MIQLSHTGLSGSTKLIPLIAGWLICTLGGYCGSWRLPALGHRGMVAPVPADAARNVGRETEGNKGDKVTAQLENNNNNIITITICMESSRNSKFQKERHRSDDLFVFILSLLLLQILCCRDSCKNP